MATFIFVGLSMRTQLANAEEPLAISESSPRALVHLLDYLGSDYSGAVDAKEKSSANQSTKSKENLAIRLRQWPRNFLKQNCILKF